VQLDKTHITVRERNYLDTLDLALRVVRKGGRWLVVAVAAGVGPMMLLNFWLLADYREADFELGWPARYMFLTLLLVAWEVPLATAPATLYLGQVLFDERPRAKTIAGYFLRSLPQLLLYQGLLRILFVFWPYLSEVILLERNPMRRRPGGRSTLSRSRTLHRGEGSDVVARWLGALAVGGLLLASVWGSMFIVRMFLVARLGWDDVLGTFYFPLALWIVVSFFGVVRFLAYLDLRIRREGWEVELLMRAERVRLERQWGTG
jgi:hypothetical protein